MNSGWPIATLGDLCERITKGSSPKWQGFRYVDSPGVLFVTSENVGENKMLMDAPKYVEEAFNEKDSRSILKRGDVLTNLVGASIGRTAIYDCDDVANINQAVGILRCIPERIFNRFLAYLLNSPVFKGVLHENEVDNARANLSLTFFKNLQIPVPPLAEQQRIVGILDEAFECIANAKANAEKNLKNARALFESHLQSVFTQRGEGWVDTTVGDQLTLQRGFDITKSQQNDGCVPVVSSGGIKSFHDTAMVQAPGVVIGRKGTLGKVFYLETEYWPHDTTLWVKDFKGNSPRFVYYLFAGLDVKALDSGAANPALNRNQVHPMPVTWPPISQQWELAETLDLLSEETQRLATIYERKLAALDELKKSLLHQVFSGNL